MHQQRSNELTVQWLRTLMRLSHDHACSTPADGLHRCCLPSVVNVWQGRPTLQPASWSPYTHLRPCTPHLAAWGWDGSCRAAALPRSTTCSPACMGRRLRARSRSRSM